ncbi:MAG: DNA translocase FtsK [Thermomicrobiales bacterium]|nr:DNA translocase FtsK [Thermomicrobiales bacterium]
MATQTAPIKGKPAPKRRSAPPPPEPARPGFAATLLLLPVKAVAPLRRIEVPLHIQRQLLAVALVLATALSTLALVQRDDSGAVTAWWGNTLAGALGKGAFLFPLLLGFLAVRSFRTRAGRLILPRHYLGLAALVFSVTGLLHLGGKAGDELGGTIGLALTTIPLRAFGELATGLIAFVCGLVGVFLLTGTDPVTLTTDIRRVWPERKPRERKPRESRQRSGDERRHEANEAINQSMAVIGALGMDSEPPPPAGATSRVRPLFPDQTDDSPAKRPARRPKAEPVNASAENLELFPTPVINIPQAVPRTLTVTPREKAKPIGPDGPFDLPEVSNLVYYDSVMPDAEALEEKARRIEATLTNFKVDARVREINPGPAVTQFTLEPGAGTKVKRITELQNDLALALAAPSIRIEAPIPGKARLGIEIPNDQIATVGLRESIESSAFTDSRAKLPLPLGRDVNGRYVVGDLAKMPHLLIAGSTGSGKSVCLNGIISTFLLRMQPSELKMVMIDPKMVEMAGYAGVPHLQCPVITEMDKVVPILRLCVKEMERRYSIFTRLSVRNLDGYKMRREDEPELENLPFFVVIVDELADLMMVAPQEVETLLVRLAQKGRACGIHLMIATQRPSAEVITGLLKANIAARIAFMVTSQLESRVVLESMGAEKLLGRGDMLFLPPDAPKPVRIQGAYVDDRGVQSIVDHWRRVAPEPRFDPEWVDIEVEAAIEELSDDGADDDLMERAIQIFRESEDRRASASYLQRRLKIGYNRAARIMEQLEAEGRVGPPDGPRGRQFLG